MSRHRRKGSVQTLVIIAVLIVVGLLADKGTFVSTKATKPPANQNHNAQIPAGVLSLQIEPKSGITPVLNLINNARTSVNLVMYELEDPHVEQALASAKNRGVAVRVLLNGGYYGKPDSTNPNQAAYDYLRTHGVTVRWTPSYFALTHQKTLTVDDKTAFIMTFNLTPRYYATSRDFGINDTDSNDVAAINTTFNNDWQNQKTTAQTGDDLLWSPGSEAASVSLIDSAKTSLKIYNEEMADSKIVRALGSAALRGVNVEVVMTNSRSWQANFTTLKTDGVRIHTYAASAPLYIHAKMILVDNSRAFAGSENFSTTSLSRNRELGIITADKGVIEPLEQTFNTDYADAAAY